MAKIRLDKYLSQTGFGTRSEVKSLLKKGSVTVNGICETDPGLKIDLTNDEIRVGERKTDYQEHVWGMLYKPAGCVTATKDNYTKTVMEYLPEDVKNRKGLFPVGRLDIDTEGLLLFTDDGETAHFILSPSRHIEKTYFALLDSSLPSEDIARMEQGLDIGEKHLTKPCKVSVASADEYLAKGDLGCSMCQEHGVLITISEGKFHQVKRMFQAVGRNVIYLKRIRMGAVELDPALLNGEFRLLNEKEMRALTSK